MIVMEALGRRWCWSLICHGRNRRRLLRRSGSAGQKAAHIPASSTAARPLRSRSSKNSR
jgi:hypothetical protein